MNLRKEKKTFFITLDQLDNFFKRIIRLAQMFCGEGEGGGESHFCRLIIKTLNIYI